MNFQETCKKYNIYIYTDISTVNYVNEQKQ